MRILMAYDGTPGARAMFLDLRRAGLPERVEARVITVATAARAPGGRALLQDESRLLAEAGAGHLRSDFPAWDVACEVVEGAAAASIVEAAERFSADLVVVGTRGLNETERVELGSVAREVVTNSRTSVRVSRAPRQGGGPVRLLLGYDASAGSEDAVAAVCARRWPDGTEVRVLAAQGQRAGGKGDLVGIQPEHSHADLGPSMDALSTKLRAAGLQTSSALRAGDARRALLDEAVVWAPDAIFLGGRRLQRLRRFLFGSVAGSVADDAPCTVEVVRPAASH